MMKSALFWFLAFIAVALIGWFILHKTPKESPTVADIVVYLPKSGDKISSPLSVSGTALGNWYFEATAPVKVLDENGRVIGQGHIDAQGDWMSTTSVPFIGSITFDASSTKNGTVVFMNDNPSGDPARQKSLSVPVQF